MRRSILFLTGCMALLSAFCSCQKVIQVHLNDSDPKIVIEADVTDKPGPYYVKLSRSVNFDQQNVFPAVSGAVVIISDEHSADTLRETAPGNYQTNTLTGMPGHKYSLYVNVGGRVFTASSTMPLLVTLDSLYTEKSSFSKDKSTSIIPVYTDPQTKGNYYHLTLSKNDTESKSIFIRNDNLINGQTLHQPLNGGNKLDPNDRIVVGLECIDSAVYQYFYTLAQTKNENSATPANPLSNITGGALGYFSAHTSSVRSLIVR